MEVITMTNGDKIRSMTDEELAENFQAMCPPDHEGIFTLECTYGAGCRDCWLVWLEQEVQG